ncbi:hypothetical protein H6P81_019053 [Aristolochia fimbriata]|uniref:VPS37 C-terminal domain-containing protein n=1 Tax=Aristolochia fimbriata TaxID=158543 RepID=A0AAV7E4T9_ARIFI|nr:hypothetical protein H6P81_019053 [Aristolochia fimbriata]
MSKSPYMITDLPPPDRRFSNGILDALKNKSLEEFQRLLTDKKEYSEFLHSIEPVRHLDLAYSDQTKHLKELASNNLEKASQLTELKNQCTVIRAELGAAYQRLHELKKMEDEINSVYSASSLLDTLRGEALKSANDSDVLHHKFLAGELPVSEFVPKYSKERTLYHRRMVTHLAAKYSSCLMYYDHV